MPDDLTQEQKDHMLFEMHEKVTKMYDFTMGDPTTNPPTLGSAQRLIKVEEDVEVIKAQGHKDRKAIKTAIWTGITITVPVLLTTLLQGCNH